MSYISLLPVGVVDASMGGFEVYEQATYSLTLIRELIAQKDCIWIGTLQNDSVSIKHTIAVPGGVQTQIFGCDPNMINKKLSYE